MNRNLTSARIRSMGSHCAHSSLCAYFEDTAYFAVSFLRFFYYYGNSVIPSNGNRQRA
jgi:hypothetical protein